MFMQRNIYARSLNHCCLEKKCITYSECDLVTLVTQHAKSMYRLAMPSVACPAVAYVSTLSHKRNDLGDKTLFRKKGLGFINKLLL